MLYIGLTGGIGSGKSTAATALRDAGAVVLDADAIAREVLEPGQPALRQVVARFGDDLLDAQGALDRPALGRVVFGDPQALAALEAITHPAIWQRTDERREQARDAGAAVVVHDMPLLVEKEMAPQYHLVLVVDTDEETRVRRLVEHRGMPEEDARSRMRSQAGDAQRRAVADVLLDNHGTPEQLRGQVERLWRERLAPYAENLRKGRVAVQPSELVLTEPDPGWADAASRTVARLRQGLGDLAVRVDHVGSTSVPMLAKPVLDLQVGVRRMEDADRPDFVAAMLAGGWPRRDEITQDRSEDGQVWPKRYHQGADPGLPVHVHVREVGSPGWRWSLTFRDWLRAEEPERRAYRAEKERLAGLGLDRGAYAEAKVAWFAAAHPRATAWATSTSWTPDPAPAPDPPTA